MSAKPQCDLTDDEKRQLLLAGGVKFDGGKSRMDLIPAEPLLLLGKIFAMGADKYDDTNWRRGMKWGRVYGALQRHLMAFWSGENIDPESGYPHVAHALWNCLILLYYSMRPEYASFDNRGDTQRFPDMPEEERQKRWTRQ